MSIDTANQIINEQEESIKELENKLLEMTDARDLALGKAIELLDSMRRIECCVEHGGGDLDVISQIARKAIDDYSGK